MFKTSKKNTTFDKSRTIPHSLEQNFQIESAGLVRDKISNGVNIAYFDCPTGISGNMILGALLNAGVPTNYLRKELKKLSIPFDLKAKKIYKNGFAATYIEVLEKSHKSYSPSEIFKIIRKSKLSKKIKNQGKAIFERLIRAEKKVHGKHKFHFHEIGMADTFIDIFGTLICLDKIKIKKVYSSPLNVGGGFISTAHGKLKAPAPATLYLLKNIPIYNKGEDLELVTPTGAVIISYLCESFGDIPLFEVKKIGMGAGTYNLRTPNILRVIIGDKTLPYERDSVLKIETNIDDMNPKYFYRAIQRIIKAGAVDACLMPILMKKRRLGFKLEVLTKIKNRDKVLEAISDETTTTGLRTYLINRKKLRTKFAIVSTKYGKVKVKKGFLDNKLKTFSPEFEECKKLADKHKLSINVVYDEVLKALRNEKYGFG